MITSLTPELTTQIEQYAKELTSGFQNTNDYERGIIQGYKEGYEDAGEKYACKWQETEKMMEKMAKAMDTLSKISGIYIDHNGLADINNIEGVKELIKDSNKLSIKALSDYNVYKQKAEALTPKQTTDDTVNG